MGHPAPSKNPYAASACGMRAPNFHASCGDKVMIMPCHAAGKGLVIVCQQCHEVADLEAICERRYVADFRNGGKPNG